MKTTYKCKDTLRVSRDRHHVASSDDGELTYNGGEFVGNILYRLMNLLVCGLILIVGNLPVGC